ncbi:O-acetyltransferase OatA [Mycolicibacterium hassiacum DSM 44199]|nr:O-acetyltransferase OatA [Mycolicibacterium hassiacum DSM 44199]
MDQGGLEQVSTSDRVASLTGVRAVAALLVVATHAAFGTGAYNLGYLGLVFARMEIGVAIFFVLSGFLLFAPWVRAAAGGGPAPRLRRYARNRARRILPAYLVTVVVVYLVYEFRDATPNPGHTWGGLLRNLTLTQVYADDYLTAYLHQGLSQMWSLAVEVAFYAVLPLLAWLLLTVLCRRRWRPGRLLAGLAALAAISPLWVVLLHGTDWLPRHAGWWLPHYLIWFIGGMMLAVLAVNGFRCYAVAVLPVAIAAFLVVATPIAGTTASAALSMSEDLAKTLLFAVVATLVVAPPALRDTGWYTRLLASRPMVWLGEISYEIFLLHVALMEIVMVSVLRWPVFTGSWAGLFAATLAVTIPAAWLLHRLTRPPVSGSR